MTARCLKCGGTLVLHRSARSPVGTWGHLKGGGSNTHLPVVEMGTVKEGPKRKPSKKPPSPAKATDHALTPEQELAASLGKFVNSTAAIGVAAAQKAAENFLEELLEYVHGDKKK